MYSSLVRSGSASPACVTPRSKLNDGPQALCFRKARAASGTGTKKAATGDEPWLGHALKRAPGVAKEVFEVMRDMIRKVRGRSSHLPCALSTCTADASANN